MSSNIPTSSGEVGSNHQRDALAEVECHVCVQGGPVLASEEVGGIGGASSLSNIKFVQRNSKHRPKRKVRAVDRTVETGSLEETVKLMLQKALKPNRGRKHMLKCLVRAIEACHGNLESIEKIPNLPGVIRRAIEDIRASSTCSQKEISVIVVSYPENGDTTETDSETDSEAEGDSQCPEKDLFQGLRVQVNMLYTQKGTTVSLVFHCE